MESVLIIRITYLDTDRILIPGVNGVLVCFQKDVLALMSESK